MDGIQIIKLPIETLLISTKWGIDCRLIEERVKEHFESNPNEYLYVIIDPQCIRYTDDGKRKPLWGRMFVRSVEHFQTLVDTVDDNITEDDLPQHIDVIADSIFHAVGFEEEYIRQMEEAMAAEYEADIMRQQEMDEWRAERFTSDGDIIDYE